VIGVYKHAKGWEIKYVQQGKRRSAYRKTEAGANEYAAKLHFRLVGPRKPATSADTPTGSGVNRNDWARLLWDLSGKVAEEPSNEDHQRALKAVAAGATAAAKFVDTAARQRRLERLEKSHERRRRERAVRQNADPGRREAISSA
jgi:hypothetical protein